MERELVFDNYEYDGKIYHIELEARYTWDSKPDMNDRGDYKFKKYFIVNDTIVVEELLDDGETRWEYDAVLISNIINSLPEFDF